MHDTSASTIHQFLSIPACLSCSSIYTTVVHVDEKTADSFEMDIDLTLNALFAHVASSTRGH